MVLRTVYVASGGGIVIYHRDEDGGMSVHSKLELPGGVGPFCVSPNRGFLFVASAGRFESFAIDAATGSLSPCGQPSPPFSDNPCYVTCDRSGRFVLHASYGGHAWAVHAVNPAGQIGAELQHESVSNNSHSIATDPTNRFAYVPCIAQKGDVGTGNAIHSYSFDAATGKLASIGPPLVPPKTYPGNGDNSRFGTRGELGPRHLTFHPYLPVLYTANEQGNSVSAWGVDRLSGGLSHVQTLSTVPDEFAETTHCSEIAIHPAGSWLLAPNRGHNSVAVFEIEPSTGRLSRTHIQPLESLSGGGPLALDSTGQTCYVGGADCLLEYFLDVNQGRLTPSGRHATPGDEAAGQIIAVDLPGRDLVARM